jgi:hypothetical protein
VSAPPVGTAPGWNAAVGGVVHPSTASGGTLRLVSAADVDSLDPARTYYVWVWLLHRMLNCTLMAYPTDAGPAGLTPVPDLAAAPPEVTDGHRTWTYRLRRGVRYDDGTEVTAHDVRHAVCRTFARDLLPGGPTTLIPLLDDPAGRYPGPYQDPAGLPTVRVPDDHTIVFHLRRPFPDFDHLVAQPATAPVPRAADTGPDYGNHPRCSGPYRISQYRPGAQLRLERNRHWDRDSDSIHPALPDRVDLTIGVEVDQLDAGLLAGNWDLCLEGRGIQHAAQRLIMADPALRANADNPETNFLQYISLQPHVPPLGNLHARRAIQHAADRILLQEARGGPVTGGEIAKLRLINASTARTQQMTFPVDVRVTHTDGAPLVEPYTTRELAIAPGGRYDVELAPTGGTDKTVTITNERDEGMVIPVRYTAADATAAASPFVAPEPTPLDPELLTRTPDVEMTLSSTMGSAGVAWTINGETFPDAETFDLVLGTTYVMRFRNSDVYQLDHPMHIHGTHFRLLTESGSPVAEEIWKDTVSIPAGTYVDVAITFDEPGTWMAHCHILDHEDGGMMTTIDVA